MINGNEETIQIKKKEDDDSVFCFKEYDSLKELLLDHHHNSEKYKLAKLDYDKEVANCLFCTDWDYVNEERRNNGLPKITNQSMKDAYIEDHLKEDKRELVLLELAQKWTYELVRFAFEYSFEAIR